MRFVILIINDDADYVCKWNDGRETGKLERSNFTAFSGTFGISQYEKRFHWSSRDMV